MQNVEINGSLLLNGSVVGASLVAGTIGSTQIGANAVTTTQLNANSVTADKIIATAITAAKISVTDLAAISADLGTITAGDITLNSAGFIRGGQTAYNTGTGFFLGNETGFKFSIGNGADQALTWDGTDLTVTGIINVGTYLASANVIASANTERWSTGVYSGSYSWSTKKTFTADKSGTVRVIYEHRKSTTNTAAPYTPPASRVTVIGTLVAYRYPSSTTYASNSVDCTVVAGDTIDLDVASGTYWASPPGEPFIITEYIRNVDFAATIIFTGSPTVILD